MDKSRVGNGIHLALLLWAAAIGAPAQTLTTLATFNGTNGAGPWRGNLVQGADGNLYGTAGEVFKITLNGTLTTFPSAFPPVTGLVNSGLLQASDGNFYGTTSYLLFKITPAGALTTLYTFCSEPNCADGISPNPPLIQANDGNLYGTTAQGGNGEDNGDPGFGTVFKITPSGTLTTLYTFCAQAGCPDGDTPIAGLIQASDGNLYGTASAGGTNGSGTAFKISLAGAFTTLHSFGNGDDGDTPNDIIQGSDGNFYGTTVNGGGAGTIFEMTSDGSVTTVYSFCSVGYCTDGGTPNTGMIQASDGNFYGTTYQGGNGIPGDGTAFQVTPSGISTTLYTFCSQSGCADGGPSVAGLVQASDGNLYGTTAGGGANNDGTIFKLALSGSTSPPSVSAGGIISASNFGAFTSIAPGSFVEIYGTNLAQETRGWTGADFTGINAPTALDGTSVSIGGQAAFVNYISPGQVNVLVPSNVATGPQSLIVTSPSGTSHASTITVNALEPGLLAIPLFDLQGIQYTDALNLDGTYVIPVNAIPGINSHAANPGDIIVLYGIGFGPVTPNTPAGQLAQVVTAIDASLQVSIGGMPATVQYAGLAPDFTGLYQFNVTVPNIPSAAAAPLTFTLNGVPGTQILYVAVQ